jgi:hypothetical protein
VQFAFLPSHTLPPTHSLAHDLLAVNHTKAVGIAYIKVSENRPAKLN